MSENCKALVLQDKCNIEIFLSSENIGKVYPDNPLSVCRGVLDYDEGGIEKSVLRITGWRHEACRVMTNGDREGQIFLYHPHTNNRFFSLLTIKYRIFIF